MRANEFVKKFGWEVVKDTVKNCPPMGFLSEPLIKDDGECVRVLIKPSDCEVQFHKDLKRLVESHELVEKYESLAEAKSHLGRIRFCIATKTWFGKALLNWSVYADKLEKAILDVESYL